MFHWTDSKIQVHAFYCVLALLLTSLLQRELAHKGEVSLPTVTAWEALSGKTGAIDKTQTVKLDGRPLLLLDSNIAWSEKIK